MDGRPHRWTHRPTDRQTGGKTERRPTSALTGKRSSNQRLYHECMAPAVVQHPCVICSCARSLLRIWSPGPEWILACPANSPIACASSCASAPACESVRPWVPPPRCRQAVVVYWLEGFHARGDVDTAGTAEAQAGARPRGLCRALATTCACEARLQSPRASYSLSQ